MTLTWYCITVTPQKELVAQIILQRKGFKTYVPIKRDFRFPNKYVRKKREKIYPLMRGYVFVGFEGARHYELMTTNTVQAFVGLEGRPYVFSGAIMDDMARRYGTGVYNAPDAHRFMRTHHEFEIGDRVKVMDGPFNNGEEYPVVELNKGRAGILADMFGMEVPVWVPTEILEAAE